MPRPFALLSVRVLLCGLFLGSWWLVGVACSSATPAASSGGGNACGGLVEKARAEVSQAIEANRACTVDADCAVVAFSASCFDSCSRVASSHGVAAIEQARSRANQGACADFTRQGCQAAPIPPCAPPAPPRCAAGVCQ